MQVNSVALTATYSAVLSLQNINTNGAVGFSLSVGQTTSDIFELYGTLDAAAVDNTNAQNLGQFTGGSTNLPANIVEQARTWPFVLIRRTGGTTAGTLFVAGNPAASPAVVTAAAPVVVGNYSALITLTPLGSGEIRIGGARQMLVTDVFDVFLSDDPALASSTGAFYAGRITGGGGSNLNTLKVSGFNYAIIQRASTSTTLTAGNIIAAGVSPSASGGSINYTPLAVGNTAANGNFGTPALTAAQSVDTYSYFTITQTTSGVTATLPTPTITTAGKPAYVSSLAASTQPILMYGEAVSPGELHLFVWDGVAWQGASTALNPTPLNVGNTAVTGAIGALTAAQTVDLYSFLIAVQTTAGNVVVTLPAPSGGTTAAGKIVTVANASTATQSFLMYGEVVGIGAAQVFMWTGVAWVSGRNLTQGGNAFGTALLFGTLDGFAVTLFQNTSTVFNDDGTTTVVGNTTAARAATIQCGTGDLNINGGGNVVIKSGTSRQIQFPPRAAGAGNVAITAWYELAASGTNFVSWQAPDTLAGDTGYVWPSAFPTIANQVLSSSTTGVSLWRGATLVRATNTSGMIIPDAVGTDTAITGWTTVTDTATAFVAATGVFTAPVAGNYTFEASIEITSIVAILNGEFRIAVFVAGASVASAEEISQVAVTSCKRSPRIGVTVAMTAGQAADIRVSQNSGSGNATMTAVAVRNYLSIALVL